jgi:phosphonate transport system substrate-binding protein
MMEQIVGLKISAWRKLVIAIGVVVISFTLVILVLAYDSKEANRVEVQSTEFVEGQGDIMIEFVYRGTDLISATLAADEFGSLLSQETGITIEVNLRPCEILVIENIGSGQADVGVLSQPGYILGHEMNGMEAKLVNGRSGNFSFRGQFNIQASSGYTNLLDLQGTRYVAPGYGSMSSDMAPYILISETTGMTPTEFFSEVTFVGGHSQVIREVYSGTADVGTTYDDARGSVEDELPDVFSVVSVLTYTAPLPNEPWVFRSGLDAGTVLSLTNGIQAVFGTVEGENTLETIWGYDLTGIAPIQDSDYDIYRALDNAFGLGFEQSLYGVCYQIFTPIITKSPDQ